MTIWKQFVSGPPDGSYNQQQYQQYYSYMQQQQQQQVCLRFIIYQTPECIQAFCIHDVGTMLILSAKYFTNMFSICSTSSSTTSRARASIRVVHR